MFDCFLWKGWNVVYWYKGISSNCIFDENFLIGFCYGKGNFFWDDEKNCYNFVMLIFYVVSYIFYKW